MGQRTPRYALLKGMGAMYAQQLLPEGGTAVHAPWPASSGGTPGSYMSWGGRLARGEEKGYGVVWGYHSMDSGKREGARPTMVSRKFKKGTHPALPEGTKNVRKCTPLCGCATALCLDQVSLSRSNYKTQEWKYSNFVSYVF